MVKKKISLSRFKRQNAASHRYFVALAMPVVAVAFVAVALAVAMAIAIAHRSSTSRKSEDEISVCCGFSVAVSSEALCGFHTQK